MGILVFSLLMVVPDDDQPPQGSYDFTGLHFGPSSVFTLSEDEPWVNDTIREELNLSSYVLTVEIVNTSISWTQNYTYSYRNGRDVFEKERDNTTFMFFTDWDYDTVYTFNIRFQCDSDNEIVRSISLFDEDRYGSGSFLVTQGRTDRVEFLDNDRLVKRSNGSLFLTYYRDLNASGPFNHDALCIQLEKRGVSDAPW